MMDKDGSFSYSSVSVINKSSIDLLSVYPNPVASNITVSYSRVGANASVKVYSMQGKQLISYPLEQGSIRSTINLSGLSKGNYLLMLNNGSGLLTKMILKQ